MKSTSILSLALALLLTSSGCAGGLIYTHTVVPLTTNFRATPVQPGPGAKMDVKHLTLYRANFVWDENAIAEIAREFDFETIHYADLEIVNVIGVWRQYKIVVYGKSRE